MYFIVVIMNIKSNVETNILMWDNLIVNNMSAYIMNITRNQLP